MRQKEFLFTSNADFLQDLENKYLNNEPLEQEWKEFFGSIGDKSNAKPNDYRPKWSKKIPCTIGATQDGSSKYSAMLLIDYYRRYGHYLANLDPLGLEQKLDNSLTFDAASFGIDNLNQQIDIGTYAFGLRQTSVADLITRLQSTYCSNIGVEFDHIDDSCEKTWLYSQLENTSSESFSAEKKDNFLQTLIEVETFENYLHVKFPGAKRFSIEGAESCILALEQIVTSCSTLGVRQAMFASAHRGRLATLVKIIGKPYRHVLAEFSGAKKNIQDSRYSGDVKYHMGYCSTKNIAGHDVQLSLAYNPSHLESINPVLAGQVRARQDYSANSSQVVGILVHGDAAFCGQGVVAESIAMASLAGYTAGGIIHVVINNQIGFTANPGSTRSSRYPTEFAKIGKIPIIHVNGDDPEAVVRASIFAASYRARFLKDVIIDVFCYRKYGHNEGDEPLYTQGHKYGIIKNKPSVSSIYAQELLKIGVLSQENLNLKKAGFKEFLDAEFASIAQNLQNTNTPITLAPNYDQSVASQVASAQLQELAKSLFSYPADFAINPKLAKLINQRSLDVEQNAPLDWGIVEALAFGWILQQGKNIRLSGQDVGRGTFSHRHSVLHSQQDDTASHIPLNNLGKVQGKYSCVDSLLSEFAVLGFEYGYSLEQNNTMVFWEAQFGDFANGAQVIIDQFITSGESKWLQSSDLVMLLPHGYEGQGPEHSSARIERFLSLAAGDNMLVAIPSTPSSYFHLLVRHSLQKTKKPLIIFTPKSLLRHKMAISSLQDLQGSFVPVLADPRKLEKVAKVLICSGKIYYDLLESATEKNINNVAIIRLEQLYPMPEHQLLDVLRQYRGAQNFAFVQEEPINMGAFGFLSNLLQNILNKLDKNIILKSVARPAAASPAAGYADLHTTAQRQIIEESLKI